MLLFSWIFQAGTEPPQSGRAFGSHVLRDIKEFEGGDKRVFLLEDEDVKLGMFMLD
jgi:hypothetical protein